jgi:hypothetical protein
MMAAAPRGRTSGTSTAAYDEEADGASAGTAPLVVMRGCGDHDDDSVVPDNMERVFAFDYNVLYRDYVRRNIFLLTIWGLQLALGMYRVVTYYIESRAMENESATFSYVDTYDDDEVPKTHQLQHDTIDKVAAVSSGLGTAGFLFLFVYTVGTLSQRWRMETERRLTVTTTGVRLDCPYRLPGPPLTLHVRVVSLSRWSTLFFIGDLCFPPHQHDFLLLHTHTQIPFSVIHSIRRKPPPRCYSCFFAAAPAVIVRHDPPARYIFRTCCSKITTTIAGLVEPDEFVSLVQRRMAVAKDHHDYPQEKAACSVMVL